MWVVDLEGETIETFSDPGLDGYRHTERARRGDSLDVAGVALTVEEVLGARDA